MRLKVSEEMSVGNKYLEQLDIDCRGSDTIVSQFNYVLRYESYIRE